MMGAVTAEDVIEEARGWKGTPFVHQGRVKGLAVDCAGLLVGVAKALGLSDYDKTDYTRIPNGKMMESVLNSNLDRIHWLDMREGDILFFGFYQYSQHLGIVSNLEPFYIIHAYEGSGKVVEHRLDSVWKKRIRGVYRYPGITE